jgi:hypothetical protein
VGVIAVVAALCCAAPSFASGGGCGLLGLRPCPPAPPPSETTPAPTERDGALVVADNPHGLESLEAPVAGQPLYPRQEGHLYFGLGDLGLADGTATADEVGGVLEALGASFVRLPLYWPGVEKQPGKYSWSVYDAQYQAFVKHGLRPLWTVFQTPRFAVASGAHCSGPQGNHCEAEPAATTEAQGRLREFGRALAARYPLAAGFEYRNEPDLDRNRKCSYDSSWLIPPDVYARDLVTFAKGVHSGRPTGRVLGGALTTCDRGPRFTAYLGRMLSAGAADGMDALSWHPYDETESGKGFAQVFTKLADALRAHHATGLRLVAGEVGFQGKEPAQAQRMADQYGRLDGGDQGLALVDHYDLFAGFVDFETKASATRRYGWVKRKTGGSFEAKDVFCAFRERLQRERPFPQYLRGCGERLM